MRLGFAIDPTVLSRAGHLIEITIPKPGDSGRVPAMQNIPFAGARDTLHHQPLREAGNLTMAIHLRASLAQNAQHFFVVYQNACVPKNGEAGAMNALDVVVRKNADLDACHNPRMRAWKPMVNIPKITTACGSSQQTPHLDRFEHLFQKRPDRIPRHSDTC